MLRMCRPNFLSGKAVVFYSGFFVSKVITELKSKGVYAESLIKNWRHCRKIFPDDMISTHFEYKDIGYVSMIEARN